MLFSYRYIIGDVWRINTKFSKRLRIIKQKKLNSSMFHRIWPYCLNTLGIAYWAFLIPLYTKLSKIKMFWQKGNNPYNYRTYFFTFYLMKKSKYSKIYEHIKSQWYECSTVRKNNSNKVSFPRYSIDVFKNWLRRGRLWGECESDEIFISYILDRSHIL